MLLPGDLTADGVVVGDWMDCVALLGNWLDDTVLECDWLDGAVVADDWLELRVHKDVDTLSLLEEVWLDAVVQVISRRPLEDVLLSNAAAAV